MSVSTLDGDQQAAIRNLIRRYYPDAQRISVTLSASGGGNRLRWHYSEDILKDEEGDENAEGARAQHDPSPVPSRESTASLQEADGDSQMGDDEAERFETPKREETYDPGSVLLTPRKDGWRALRRERPMGEGSDWWRQYEDNHVTFVRARSVLPDEGRLGTLSILSPEASGFLEELDEEDGDGSQRSPSPGASDPNGRSWSVSTDATVIIDEQTRKLPAGYEFTDEPLVVRQPTPPVLATIQEEGSSSGENMQAGPSNRFELDVVRVFRNEEGVWGREGSQGPNAMYHIDRELLPPRVDVQVQDHSTQAGPSTSRRSSKVKGSPKTTPSKKGKGRRARVLPPVPYVLLTPLANLRRAEQAQKAALRRSERLKGRTPA